jgi:hypothetical protein
LTACRESESTKKKPTKPSKSKKTHSWDKPVPGIDKAIEKFTGAHTRIVWAECMKPKDSDTFANGNDLALKGVDTADGKGERAILEKQDNYSRPLLTSNGETIVYTDKAVKRQDGKKHYDPDIYRTDWKGSKPTRLAEGYAVDCWNDPATGVEWVYAARQFTTSKSLSLEGRELVRFPLNDPSKIEVVYDDSRISPDNIQLSRDGARASGLFPWPNVGVFIRDESGKYHPKKLQTGCWPSLAPDDSGVSWVFDGGHRSATFFAADGKKSWTVKFDDCPGTGAHEMYHPRWSNHPRYIAITGPYVPGRRSSGNAINKGGASADVYLGRFSENLDKVEAWLQITDDKLSESYPDVWIEGAEKEQLAAFPKTVPAQNAATTWPAITSDILFLWHDRNALNQFKDPSGRLHTSAPLQLHRTARYGRLEEMVVDDGYFEVDDESAGEVMGEFKTPGDVTLEMVLLPAQEQANDADGLTIFRAPNFRIAQDGAGHLVVSDGASSLRSEQSMPATAFHLIVVRRKLAFEAMVNGKPVTFEHGTPGEAVPIANGILFGGGWSGGIMGVGIYKRALSQDEMTAEAKAQVNAVAKLPPAPPQVKVQAKLIETSDMPTAEGIAPYTASLVAYVYEVEKVVSGKLDAKRILVKHWAMLDQKPLAGFPRETGKVYELLLEREDAHLHLKGERVMDDTTAFDLEPWFDVSTPRAQ